MPACPPAGLRPCWCPGADAVELRLAAGGGPCAGRVEVKLQGRWGSVGDDQWDMEDAEVVCQHLGCGSAAGAYSASSSFGNGEGPVSLALVDCHGDEATFWDCEIRGWGPYAAPHIFDTAVTCQGRSRATVGTRGGAGTSLTVTPRAAPGRVCPAGRWRRRLRRAAGGAARPSLGQCL